MESVWECLFPNWLELFSPFTLKLVVNGYIAQISNQAVRQIEIHSEGRIYGYALKESRRKREKCGFYGKNHEQRLKKQKKYT